MKPRKFPRSTVSVALDEQQYHRLWLLSRFKGLTVPGFIRERLEPLFTASREEILALTGVDLDRAQIPVKRPRSKRNLPPGPQEEED